MGKPFHQYPARAEPNESREQTSITHRQLTSTTGCQIYGSGAGAKSSLLGFSAAQIDSESRPRCRVRRATLFARVSGPIGAALTQHATAPDRPRVMKYNPIPARRKAHGEEWLQHEPQLFQALLFRLTSSS